MPPGESHDVGSQGQVESARHDPVGVLACGRQRILSVGEFHDDDFAILRDPTLVYEPIFGYIVRTLYGDPYLLIA